MLVIDGTNLVFGRAATKIAKSILNGEEVHVINAEKFVLTGNPKSIMENILARRRAQHKGTPERSPVWSKNPNLLVRRMIRGMLPWKSSRGKEAFKRLKVYVSNPKNLTNAQTIDVAKFTKQIKHMTIYEVCKRIGYTR